MQMVTGNRLRDGVPVYFIEGGRWSPALDDASLVDDTKAEALLAEALSGPKPLPVVAPVLIEASRQNGHIEGLSLRERIRAEGPTTGPMTHQRLVTPGAA
jgi:sulfite reductase (NADPH) hemoprotein beta-component